MNQTIFKFIDKLFVNSEKLVNLRALQKLFNTAIPFNIPHRFKFVELSKKSTRIKLPLMRNNKNHLGGIHACAIATLGEYPAGLTLIKYFGASKYRIVMSKLEVTYLKQGKSDLIGKVDFPVQDIDRMEKELATDKKTTATIQTDIIDANEEVVAIVLTTWQLKDWSAVSFKG